MPFTNFRDNHRRRGARLLTALLWPACALFLTACSALAPSGTAIVNVTVIDAVHGTRAGQTVIFRGDRILSVAPSSGRPGAAKLIDGSGKYLIPGLWDMHVHLTYDPRLVATMPARFLAWGITSVRDTGGMLAELLPVVNAMRQPGALAPRVFFSGPLLDGERVVYDGNGVPHIGTANGSARQASDNVRKLHAAGVDFIKIYEMVSPAVFAELVAAARHHDLPVAAHVPLSMTALEAGAAVDSMEHLRNIELACAANSDQLLRDRRAALGIDAPKGDGRGHRAPNPATSPSARSLRSALHQAQRAPAIAAFDAARCAAVIDALKETIQVPTARLNALTLVPAFRRPDWAAALAELPPSVQAEWSKAEDAFFNTPEWLHYSKFSQAMIGRLFAAGVPIGAGTDTPIGWAIPGYSLHNELDMLVRAGLPPLEALRAATVVPARFLQLEDTMGAIAPGRVADMVLLDANPLLDIGNTKRIAMVIARGREVPR